MAVDWDQDLLAPIMSADVFGEDVKPIFHPASGGSFPIDGVFDRPYKGLVVEADGEPAISTREPLLGVRLSQFVTPPLQGDTVVVDGVGTYVVTSVEPDGKGWALLRLNMVG